MKSCRATYDLDFTGTFQQEQIVGMTQIVSNFRLYNFKQHVSGNI